MKRLIIIVSIFSVPFLFADMQQDPVTKNFYSIPASPEINQEEYNDLLQISCILAATAEKYSGTGLGRGLTALAESKLNGMIAKNKHIQAKEQLVALGIPEHEAECVSHQDPETQWQTARSWLIAGGIPEEMVPKTLDDEWKFTPEQEASAQQQIKQMLEQQGQQGRPRKNRSDDVKLLNIIKEFFLYVGTPTAYRAMYDVVKWADSLNKGQQ